VKQKGYKYRGANKLKVMRKQDTPGEINIKLQRTTKHGTRQEITKVLTQDK